MNQQKARERRAWQREMGRYGVKMNDSCGLPAGADGLLIRLGPVQLIKQRAGWTVFLCQVAIWNVSLDPIQLAKCFLRPPWSNERFELIDPDAQVSASQGYCLPDGELYCARSDAINHDILNGRTIMPGECIRGMLLGQSLDPIPERFIHHSKVEGTIVIVDQSGREFSEPIRWLVERSQRTAAQKKRYWEMEKTGSIFEREPGSSPAVEERQSVVLGGGAAADDPRDAHEGTSRPGRTSRLTP
jgi:hypothetical protein